MVLLYTIALVALLAGVSTASAQRLIVFGDSLSDTGVNAPGGGFSKTAQLVLQTDEVFPQPPYYQGRYSNGPVWVDYAVQSLQIDRVNWAAGGAVTGAGFSEQGVLPAGFAGFPGGITVNAPNIYQQIDQNAQANNNTVSSTDVVVVFIGNNDYFSIKDYMKNVTAEDVVANIINAMDELYDEGARTFIVFTIPPVVVLQAQDLANTALVTAWTEHNPLLKSETASFNQTHPNSNVTIFDFEALVLKVITNAAQYGFTSAIPCYNISAIGIGYGYEAGVPVCSDPTHHFTWDGVHPTTAAHAIVGNAFAQQFGYLWGKSASPVAAPAMGPISG